MDNDFKITFVINLDSTNRNIVLTANVSLHHSSPYYRIYGIRAQGKEGELRNLLPDLAIKCINIDGNLTWVHVDSRKKSSLSEVVGRAIEETVKDRVKVALDDPQVASENENDPE